MHSLKMELEDGEEQKKKNSSLLSSFIKWLPPISSSKSSLPTSSPETLSGDPKMTTTQRKPGGWRAMPFVLGNETFERLASFGLAANFTVFLLRIYHMDQVSASNLMNIWTSISNFTPLLGAFISDSYIGRFWAIAFSSFVEILGMLTLTIIVSVPRLRPAPCTAVTGAGAASGQQCKGPTRSQLGFLIMALGFLSIGAGGIRPCSIPFGVDQFDSSTEEGRKGINSFFNWYYTSFTVVLIIATTVVVYIQDSVSWIIGFAIPTGLMISGVIVFLLGMRLYVYVKPQGSVFSGIARVIMAAYRKRRVRLPDDGVVYYDPPSSNSSVLTKLPLTKDCRFLNKAAVVMEGDINGDGKCRNPWRLSSIQEMEEVKCIIRVIPIWPAGIMSALAMIQQGTFTVNQALHMDRHLGPNFQIPPGSLFVVSLITIALWLPLYDRLLVPWIRKRTRNEGGITMLQRIGIGLALTIIAMVVSGFVEIKRRASATAAGGGAPISVAWLFPQLAAMGFAEAFNILGQIEFYNKEFPENMIGVGNSLTSVTWGVAGYLSTLLVNVVHKTTSFNGRPDWLIADINAGRVDNFYFVIAAMGMVNLVYFVLVARRYRYKSKLRVVDGGDDDLKV